jgi:hypothetical protein
VINRDAAFSQQLLHIAVGEAVAQVPADGHQDANRTPSGLEVSDVTGWGTPTTFFRVPSASALRSGHKH